VGSYKVFIKPSAVKELEAVGTKKDRQRIASKILSLADDPRPPGSVKLSGSNRLRIRVGTYRIVYAIEDDRCIVLIIRIGHRREIYRAG